MKTIRSQAVMPVSSPRSTAAPRPALMSAEMTDDRCFAQLGQLQEVLHRLQVRSVFLVADAGAYRLSGAEAVVAPLLEAYQWTCFSDFEPNPKREDVEQGLARFRQSQAEVVLAIGGGTAIDIAKLIAAMSHETCSLLEIVQKKKTFDGPGTPLIAVPTTSGTGSEATQFAVVYVEGVKYSVDHPRLLPDYCILDATLTATLPAYITACTGLDAFSQAIESLWSVRSNERSSRDAREAIQLAWTHLAAAVHAPTAAARAGMCRASHLAGRAINQTRTTAAHAVSYAFTSQFGIPHGHAVALTLGAMLEYNAAVNAADVNDPRGVEHVRQAIGQILQLLGCASPAEGRARIEAFVNSLGCEIRLYRLGIDGPADWETILGKVNLERLDNNPRRLNNERLREMLQSLS